MPRFPDITVELTGQDGNAFSILARVSRALRKAGESEAAEEYLAAATAGDYDNLLRVTMEFVDVE